MPEHCTCGAQLPPDARFCHKCGKPQYDYPNLEEEPVAEPVEPLGQVPPPLPALAKTTEIGFGNRAAVRAGFVAALVAVLLAVIPIPMFPVLRLTIAFVAAGFFAVFLYVRRTGQPLSLRSGARMGWMTGIFSFTIFTVQLTLTVLATSEEGGLAGAIKKTLPPNDARNEQVLQMIQEPSTLALMMLVVLFFLFILLTALPTLGGLLGAKLLTREQ